MKGCIRKGGSAIPTIHEMKSRKAEIKYKENAFGLCYHFIFYIQIAKGFD